MNDRSESAVIEMPVFPLGSVLFPSMPLALRVFEERYLAMLASVLQDEPAEFGRRTRLYVFSARPLRGTNDATRRPPAYA